MQTARHAAVLAAGLLACGTVAHVDGSAAVRTASCPPRPPATEQRITRPRWVAGAVVTEYYPIRERWFGGKAVRVPGLPGRHRVDWLYGPHGVAMNGEGLGRDGRFYHFAGPYDVGWVDRAGRATTPCWNGRWTSGEPAWLDFGWRNARGQVTYPLAGGGWSNGAAARYVAPPAGLRFAAGRSRPLPFWHVVATDPHVVPYGSRVFIAAYCDTPAHGWFRALDTGGAIIGFHFDVYRSPPSTLVLRALRRQRVYVVPPGARATAAAARCR
ncbi:MAG TPA: 3D domain-containing protein [Gaiellaceae bacterium]|nr:3D domain-containing protein [Gaiellaceae bacterium]